MELDGGSSKGLLLPRMRKQDIDAIQNPAEGLTIYATDEQAVYLRKSLVWEKQAPFTLPGDYSINFINTALRIQNSGDGDAILGTVQGAGTGVKGYGGGLGSYGVEGVSNSIGGAGGVFYNNFSGATALATTKGRVGLGTLFPIAQLHINGQ